MHELLGEEQETGGVTEILKLNESSGGENNSDLDMLRFEESTSACETLDRTGLFEQHTEALSPVLHSRSALGRTSPEIAFTFNLIPLPQGLLQGSIKKRRICPGVDVADSAHLSSDILQASYIANNIPRSSGTASSSSSNIAPAAATAATADYAAAGDAQRSN